MSFSTAVAQPALLRSVRLPSPGRRAALVAAATLALATVWGVGALIAAVGGDPQVAPDLTWAGWLAALHDPALTPVALALDYVGGGPRATLVTVVIALALVVARGWRAGCYLVVVAVLSWGDVQLLKHFAGRVRPAHELLVATGGSFPSEHTANAAVLAVALGLLLGRKRVWLIGAGWVALMAAGRTYLEVHYLSDVAASVVVAAAVAVGVWAVLPRAVHPAADQLAALPAHARPDGASAASVTAV